MKILTDVLELLGLLLVIAGVWLAFGIAPALILLGAALIGLSFLITTRGGRRS